MYALSGAARHLRSVSRAHQAAGAHSRTLASVSKFSLPDLPYEYSALEPVIGGEIMELHHAKHHATYVNNLNTTLEKLADAQGSNNVDSLVGLQSALNFNGGGHINHSIFWTNLAPVSKGGGEVPSSGPLYDAIRKEFGSVEEMVSKFNTMTAGVQGSGWGWLGVDQKTKALVLTTCANQDPPSSKGIVPLLGIDVWEHAYYLQYKNARPAYLKEIWKVVNWQDVAMRFKQASK